MKTEHQAVSLVREWLESESGYDFVRRFVKCVLSPGNSHNQPSYLATYLHFEENASPDALLEEVTHDFLLFLLTFAQNKLAGQPALVAQLYAGKHRYFLDSLWQRYLWMTKDKGRIKNDNPRGYLYRRFREVLGTEAGFSTCVNNTGRLFYRVGKVKEEAIVEAVNILAEETYNDYPMVNTPLQPDAEGNFRITGKWLKTTAEFFYALAKERYPQQQYFAVSELVRYLGRVVPWLNNPTRVSHESDYEAERQNINPIDRLRAPGENEDIRIDRLRQTRSICPLAGQIVSCWDRVQCCVFAWRLQEPPLTLKNIAEKLSLLNHNEAYGLFAKTQRSLKRFCSNWPGPPLRDLAPGVAEIFVNKVRQHAKKKCDGP